MSRTTQSAAPLEWSDLWDAMRADPGRWVPTTEAMFWAMLGAVPPADQTRGAFLTGEPNHHDAKTGDPVYACFQETGRGVFARYLTRAEFRGGELATVHAAD